MHNAVEPTFKGFRACVEAVYAQVVGQTAQSGELIDRNALSKGAQTDEYFNALTQDVSTHYNKILARISAVADREPRHFDPLTLSLLIVGCAEIEYMKCADGPLVISRCIQLSKTFMGDRTFKIINATLDRIFKEGQAASPKISAS